MSWPRLFHDLRAACQTEFANTFHAHVVREWIGIRLAVAQELYLQTTEDHDQQATQNPAHGVARNAAQTGANVKRPERTNPDEVLEDQAFRPILSAPVYSGLDVRMTLRGLEPRFEP